MEYEIEEYPILSQDNLKVTSMCVLVALAVSLRGGKVHSDDLLCDDMIDKALELGITDPVNGGISAAGCVKLAMEYGKPEFGALGPLATAEEGQNIIRHYIKQGRPVVVMVTSNLNPRGSGHAVCVLGIDKNNNLKIHDSGTSISGRGKPDQEHPLGKPIWAYKEGTYIVTWEEFDRSWNTIDNYVTVADETWDKDGSISSVGKDKNWMRFWCAVFPK